MFPATIHVFLRDKEGNEVAVSFTIDDFLELIEDIVDGFTIIPFWKYFFWE